jgi:hypothetical protein
VAPVLHGYVLPAAHVLLWPIKVAFFGAGGAPSSVMAAVPLPFPAFPLPVAVRAVVNAVQRAATLLLGPVFSRVFAWLTRSTWTSFVLHGAARIWSSWVFSGFLWPWARSLLLNRCVLQYLWYKVVARVAMRRANAMIRWLLPRYRMRWVVNIVLRLIRFQLRGFRFAVRLVRRLVVFAWSAALVCALNVRFVYAVLLHVAARCCSRLGLFGNLLSIPVSLAWIFWPLYAMYMYSPAHGVLAHYAVATLVCFVFLQQASDIIKRGWSGQPLKWTFRNPLRGVLTLTPSYF